MSIDVQIQETPKATLNGERIRISSDDMGALYSFQPGTLTGGSQYTRPIENIIVKESASTPASEPVAQQDAVEELLSPDPREAFPELFAEEENVITEGEIVNADGTVADADSESKAEIPELTSDDLGLSPVEAPAEEVTERGFILVDRVEEKPPVVIEGDVFLENLDGSNSAASRLVDHHISSLRSAAPKDNGTTAQPATEGSAAVPPPIPSAQQITPEQNGNPTDGPIERDNVGPAADANVITEGEIVNADGTVAYAPTEEASVTDFIPVNPAPSDAPTNGARHPGEIIIVRDEEPSEADTSAPVTQIEEPVAPTADTPETESKKGSRILSALAGLGLGLWAKRPRPKTFRGAAAAMLNDVINKRAPAVPTETAEADHENAARAARTFRDRDAEATTQEAPNAERTCTDAQPPQPPRRNIVTRAAATGVRGLFKIAGAALTAVKAVVPFVAGFGAGWAARLGMKAAIGAVFVASPSLWFVIPAGMLAGAVGGALSSVVLAAFSKTKREEQNWVRKAMRRGALTGAIGGAAGAYVADYVNAHGGMPFVSEKLHAAKVYVADMFGSDAAAQKITDGAANVAQGIAMPQAYGSMLTADQFHALPKAIQALAADKSPAGVAHFCKEASYHLINGAGHTEETLKVGAKLISHGVAVVDGAGLHNVTTQQLHNDYAFLKQWGLGGLPKSADEALYYAKAAASEAKAAGRPLGYAAKLFTFRHVPA